MSFPLIATFVYLGVSLSSELPDDFLYFQPAETYARHGSVVDSPDGDRRVRCISYDEACEEMLTIEALTAELVASRKRRKKSA